MRELFACILSLLSLSLFLSLRLSTEGNGRHRFALNSSSASSPRLVLGLSDAPSSSPLPRSIHQLTVSLVTPLPLHR